MKIGHVAERAGLQPSAIRYYERCGLLPIPPRSSGRREYGEQVLLRLRVIRFARESGFTLAEIRRLFAGRRYSRQLHRLALRKVAELEEAIRRARTMQLLLRSALRCKCLTVEECGRRLSAVTLPGAVKAPVGRPMPARPVHRSRGPSAPLE